MCEKYYTLSRDITELKKSEEKEQNTERELIDHNHFIETIPVNLPIGLAINDIDEGRASYMNRQFEKIYG